MKKKTKVFNVIFLTLPALFLALMMAEIALRVSGSIHFATRNHSTKETPPKGVVRFLCLGDSFTFGLGVPPQDSYPEQLKKILEENGYPSIAVYNAGVPGINSSLVANHLRKDIDKYHPNFIMIMVGLSNAWNLEESSFFLMDQMSLPSTPERVLSKMRIYKLIKISYLSLKYKQPPLMKQTDASFINLNSIKACQDGNIFFGEGKYKLAEEYFDKALLFDPHNYKAYLNKATLLVSRKDYALAKEALRRAMSLVDYYTEKDFKMLFNVILRVAIHPDERLPTIERLEWLIKEYVKDPLKKRRFLKITMLQKELLKDKEASQKILAYDLNRILVLAQQQNIKVILLTYPSDHDINDTLRETSLKYNVPLVDNERIFKEKSKHMNEKDLFVSQYDRHCSVQGNRIIAENIYGLLVAGNYLPPILKSPCDTAENRFMLGSGPADRKRMVYEKRIADI